LPNEYILITESTREILLFVDETWLMFVRIFCRILCFWSL